jgi:hypothetical protein
MSLIVTFAFTTNAGTPATGLTLSEIACYLTKVAKADGTATVVWDGSQHPTAEVDNMGAYLLIDATADLDGYDYFASAHYTGATALDMAWCSGSASSEAQRIADATLQRDMADVEDDAAVHSLATAVLKAVSKTAASLHGDVSVLEVYQTDGVTVKMEQTLTTDEASDPIVGLGVGSG